MRFFNYQLKFNTPAFLGDAEQNGRWRTPPIKALLRQWWRVAYAADHNFRADVAAMRQEEGLLFGHAWLENDIFERNGRQVTTAARKSAVRIRLDKWDEGQSQKNQWPRFATVSHPEVPKPVASDLYLGYGPVTLPRGASPTLKANTAIQADEKATLSLAVPTTHKDTELKRLLEDNVPRIERALWLMDRYGTLGGRSRNGWGSFALLPLPPGESRGEGDSEVRRLPLRDWKDCLNLDWPHAIGQDAKGPLIWQTAPHDDWKVLMKTLAVIKIGLRTQFVFPNVAPPHAGIEPRHWLSYPITKHTTRAWDRGARLPNSLRFKVRPVPDSGLVGVIFHVPHLPPAAFNPHPNRAVIERTWEQVHGLLDHLKHGSPRTYPMIPEVAPVNRRSALKPQLDTVTLTRILE